MKSLKGPTRKKSRGQSIESETWFEYQHLCSGSNQCANIVRQMSVYVCPYDIGLAQRSVSTICNTHTHTHIYIYMHIYLYMLYTIVIPKTQHFLGSPWRHGRSSGCSPFGCPPRHLWRVWLARRRGKQAAVGGFNMMIMIGLLGIPNDNNDDNNDNDSSNNNNKDHYPF